MALEEKFLERWDVYGVLAAVERHVGNGADDRIQCLYDYVDYDGKIGRNGKYLIISLTSFSLLVLRLFRLRIIFQKILMAFN